MAGTENMKVFVIHDRRGARYLEWIPFYQAWSWLAAFPSHATTFRTRVEAEAVAKTLDDYERCEVLEYEP